MSYKYGKTSNKRLDTCHPDLIRLFDYALLHPDCPCDITIVCGERGREAQEKAFCDGKSKAKFGQSPHNFEPSYAVDAAPYVKGVGIPWDDKSLFRELAAHIKACADDLGIHVTWGGNFKSFCDMPHWEITHWRACI